MVMREGGSVSCFESGSVVGDPWFKKSVDGFRPAKSLAREREGKGTVGGPFKKADARR